MRGNKLGNVYQCKTNKYDDFENGLSASKNEFGGKKPPYDTVQMSYNENMRTKILHITQFRQTP